MLEFFDRILFSYTGTPKVIIEIVCWNTTNCDFLYTKFIYVLCRRFYYSVWRYNQDNNNCTIFQFSHPKTVLKLNIVLNLVIPLNLISTELNFLVHLLHESSDLFFLHVCNTNNVNWMLLNFFCKNSWMFV